MGAQWPRLLSECMVPLTFLFLMLSTHGVLVLDQGLVFFLLMYELVYVCIDDIVMLSSVALYCVSLAMLPFVFLF